MSDPARLTSEQMRGLRNLEKGYSLQFAVDYYAREDGLNVLDVLEAQEAELSRLRELLEQAEVDTERKVDAELRGRLEKAEAALAVAEQERDVAKRSLGEACQQYRLEHDLCVRYRDALERIEAEGAGTWLADIAHDVLAGSRLEAPK